MDRPGGKPVRTIAVTSGKGGVGKTNFTANLAVALSQMGKEVLVFDADLGLSNIDVLLDLAPEYNIEHVLKGTKTLSEVIVEGPYGIKILPASSGVQELSELSEHQRANLLNRFDSYQGDLDYLLVDTAAGISSNVGFFCAASEEIIVITSPEPTALTDAYALIKVLFTGYQEKRFEVLVNSATNEDEALDTFRKLSRAAEHFLSLSIGYLGYIPRDEIVPKAVKRQRAFVDMFPSSEASRSLLDIARKLVRDEDVRVKGSLQFFFGSLLGVKAGTGAPGRLNAEGGE